MTFLTGLWTDDTDTDARLLEESMAGAWGAPEPELETTEVDTTQDRIATALERIADAAEAGLLLHQDAGLLLPDCYLRIRDRAAGSTL